MTMARCLPVLLILLLAGCDKLPSLMQRDDAPPPGAVRLRSAGQSDSNRYQLHATPDGKTLRLDTQTGQTSLVTEKGLTTLPDDRRIQLRVGEIYTLENGKSALYEGNQKLVTDTHRIADALVNKYSEKSKTDPLGIRK